MPEPFSYEASIALPPSRSSLFFALLQLLLYNMFIILVYLGGVTKLTQGLDEGFRVHELRASIRDPLATAAALTLTSVGPLLQVRVLNVATSTDNEHDTLLVLRTLSSRLGVSASRGSRVEREVIIGVLQGLRVGGRRLHESLDKAGDRELLLNRKEVLHSRDEVVETDTRNTSLAETVSNLRVSECETSHGAGENLRRLNLRGCRRR